METSQWQNACILTCTHFKEGEKHFPKPNFLDRKTCNSYIGPGFQLLLQDRSCKKVPLKQLAYHVKLLRKAKCQHTPLCDHAGW